MPDLDIATYIAAWPSLRLEAAPPWTLTGACEHQVRLLLARLGPGYRRQGDSAIHETAVVEAGAVLKGPVIRSSSGPAPWWLRAPICAAVFIWVPTAWWGPPAS